MLLRRTDGTEGLGECQLLAGSDMAVSDRGQLLASKRVCLLPVIVGKGSGSSAETTRRRVATPVRGAGARTGARTRLGLWGRTRLLKDIRSGTAASFKCSCPVRIGQLCPLALLPSDLEPHCPDVVCSGEATNRIAVRSFCQRGLHFESFIRLGSACGRPAVPSGQYAPGPAFRMWSSPGDGEHRLCFTGQSPSSGLIEGRPFGLTGHRNVLNACPPQQ